MDDDAEHVAAIRAVLAEPAELRARALTDAVVEFGPSFVSTLSRISASPAAAQLPDSDQNVIADLARRAAEMLNAWLTGERITTRADERERRVLVIKRLAAADPGDTVLARLAADAILRLPAGSEQRDLAFAREILLDQVTLAHRPSGDVNDLLAASYYLLHHNLLTPQESSQLIDDALAAMRGGNADPSAVRDLIRAAHDYCIVRAGEALIEAGDELPVWMGRAERLLDVASTEHPELGSRLTAMRARQLDVADDAQRAADAYAKSVDTSVSPGSREIQWTLLSEATLRLQSGEYQRVLDRLMPLLPTLADRYLTAVTDADIADAGFAHGRAVTLVTSALIRLGEGEGATCIVDSAKSLRLRYRAALRQHPARADILELERAILAASRGNGSQVGIGAGDAAGTEPGLPLRIQLLERYRRMRPDLGDHVGRSRSIGEIAAALDPDETAVILAGLDDMTMLSLITSQAQRLTVGLADWPWSRWDDLLADSGWLAFLAKDQEVDGPAALMSLIENVDGRIGQRILELRGQAGADSRGKVAIIPHRWLHLIPYWALPSFADIPVSVFSSADEFVTSRKRETGLGGRGRECVIVANPTKDLLCSPSEARSVLRLGMPASTVLTAEAPSRATASVIASCLEDSALFHFSGHAYSDHGNPDNCAFLVAPASEQASDPFEEWVAAVTDWRKAAGGWRTGDVPGVGRLSERQYPDAGRLERRMERGYAPTLYALYIAGKLRRLGELWSVGDILAMGQSMPCRLAFLSACESGAAGGSSAYIDEYGGLPAALRLGGVGSVVCSMWDVDEGFTALYVDRFYCEVLAGQDDPVTILRQVSRWFREMRKADVLTALDHLADEVRERSAHAAMMLEAYRDKIDKTRGDVPYADAWEWASFYVIGGGRIGLAEFINHRG